MPLHGSLVTRALLMALPICAIAGVAHAQYDAPPPPPPTYIATVEPVYYEGQPRYWYNNHWYWRDAHGSWSYYHDEPAFLRDHRAHAPPARHIEERRGEPHRR